MTKLPSIKDASGGFTGYLWQVDDGKTQQLVHALSNYDAAEAVGLRYPADCKVRPMRVVPD